MASAVLSGLAERVSRHRSILGSVAALFSGNMAASILGALGGLLVARFIGPEEAGRFRTYTIPLLYLTFLHLGTFDGLTRQIPFYTGLGRTDQVEAVASASGAWNLLVSTGASVVFLLLAGAALVRGDFHGLGGWLSQALCAWGVYYAGYLRATYRTIHHFVDLARTQLIQAVIAFGMVFLVPFTGFFGLCMRGSIPLFAATGLLHRGRPLRIRHRLDWRALGGVIRVGLPFSFWGSLNTSVWAATESTLMLSLGGLRGLGLLAVAVVIRDGLNVLPQSVYQVLTPRVVEAYAREGSVRQAHARAMVVTAGLVLAVLAVVGLGSLLLGHLVPLLIPKYAQGVPLMRLCLWFSVVEAAALPFNTLFATGRSILWGRGVAVGLAVFAICAHLLVPIVGGMMAVGWGSLLGRVARTLVGYLELTILTRKERP